jgi:hypothetical protein
VSPSDRVRAGASGLGFTCVTPRREKGFYGKLLTPLPCPLCTPEMQISSEVESGGRYPDARRRSSVNPHAVRAALARRASDAEALNDLVPNAVAEAFSARLTFWRVRVASSRARVTRACGSARRRRRCAAADTVPGAARHESCAARRRRGRCCSHRRDVTAGGCRMMRGSRTALACNSGHSSTILNSRDTHTRTR